MGILYEILICFNIHYNNSILFTDIPLDMTKNTGLHAEGRCPLKIINGTKSNLLVKPTPIYPRKPRKPCELFSPASIIEQENKENIRLKPMKIEVNIQENYMISPTGHGQLYTQNKSSIMSCQQSPHLPVHNHMSPHSFTCRSINQTKTQVCFQCSFGLLVFDLHNPMFSLYL